MAKEVMNLIYERTGVKYHEVHIYRWFVITTVLVVTAILSTRVVVGDASAKKHETEETRDDICFNVGREAGKDKAFGPKAEDACGNDLYREGFMSG